MGTPDWPELAGHLRVDGDALLAADPDDVRDQLRLGPRAVLDGLCAQLADPATEGAEKQTTPSRVTVQVNNRLRMFRKPNGQRSSWRAVHCLSRPVSHGIDK